MRNLSAIVFIFCVLMFTSCSDGKKGGGTPEPETYASLEAAKLVSNGFSKIKIEENPSLVFESQSDNFDEGTALLILNRFNQKIPFQYKNSVAKQLTLTIDKSKLPQGKDVFDGIIEVNAGKSGEFKLENVKFHVPYQAAETEGEGELK